MHQYTTVGYVNSQHFQGVYKATEMNKNLPFVAAVDTSALGSNSELRSDSRYTRINTALHVYLLDLLKIQDELFAAVEPYLK